MSWEKVKLGEVTESCLGKMLDQKKNKGSYKPYLANVNVRWGFFDLDNLQEMRFEDDEDEKYGIKFKGGTKNERCFKGNGRKKKYS